MSTTLHPRDWHEGRRWRAWELQRQGWTQNDIAVALGVTQGAVSRWLKRGREQGVEALRRHPPPGRPSKLTPEQRAKIPVLLARGAEAFGFGGQVWTTRRIAAVIQQELGVQYHPDHVSRLLRAIGWTPQKPVKRATQRNEPAIAEWYNERWPALKAKPMKQDEPSSG